ncbi:unnamed protein product, partial [Anisakis simplex]|uniref:Uncharacterized protein n=1 Tax=Anisakis simplex TaxID=6269 RepID=A0A0M3JQ11_ANISI
MNDSDDSTHSQLMESVSVDESISGNVTETLAKVSSNNANNTPSSPANNLVTPTHYEDDINVDDDINDDVPPSLQQETLME